jgi:hypothetical protein
MGLACCSVVGVGFLPRLGFGGLTCSLTYESVWKGYAGGVSLAMFGMLWFGLCEGFGLGVWAWWCVVWAVWFGWYGIGPWFWFGFADLAMWFGLCGGDVGLRYLLDICRLT